ncbi:hypothetical protein PORY_002457 [Pneumocystis oryctolagi]|uniref:Uncharacterized protein n=1 Tax=Pneumocystis oryctolagi TaxID=42067 RepID=A0ACB7C987_9ASCO|nr:hypothetical protein PORY_002457 [Pneumocystis oryctolagi]
MSTNVSEIHSILEKTLSFKKKFKKGKNLKINKTNIELKSNKNISSDDIIIQDNQEKSAASSLLTLKNTLKNSESKNKHFIQNSPNSFESLTSKSSLEDYREVSMEYFFSKPDTFSQKSESSIESYVSNPKVAHYNGKKSDAEGFSDLKTSAQSIDHIYENYKSTYNTCIRESNSLSSVSERSSAGFFSSVLSAAQNAASSLTSLTTHGSSEDKIISRKLSITNKKLDNSKDLAKNYHESSEYVLDTYEPLKKKELKKRSTSIIPSIGYGELSLSDVKISEDTLESSIFVDEKSYEKELSFDKKFQEISDNKLINYGLNQKNHTLIPSQILVHEKLNNIIQKPGHSTISCLNQQNKYGYIASKNNQQNTIHMLIQKITGTAIASSKRNKEFHTLFKSIPEDDYLIDDYASALQKDILLHGRMYVSETYICFNSNIFGWITSLVISFLEIVSIDKKCTAVVFPNAIQITTLHAKYIFSSFISRDTTYDLLINIWRLTNPSTRTQAVETSIIDDKNSENYERNSTKDENIDKKVETENMQNISKSSTNENTTEDMNEILYKNFPKKKNFSTINDINLNIESLDSAKYKSTECDCLSRNEHYEKQICDEIIQGPLPKVTNLCFGEESAFMIDFLGNIQKVSEIKLGDWQKDSSGKKIRHISYLKPLYGPVGPKQTHCKIIETIEHEDNNYMTVSSITKTPDVPSGNSFIVKTKYCMMWDKNNCTRIIATCTTDWTKSSWLKSPIEKGANEGQVSYIKDLIDAITNALKNPINEKSIEKKTFKKLQKLYKNENSMNDKKIQKIPNKKKNPNIKLELSRTLKFSFRITLKFFIFITKINTIILILLLIIFFKLIQLEKTIQNISLLTNVHYKTLNNYNSLLKQKDQQTYQEHRVFYNIQISKSHSTSFFDNIKKESFRQNANNKKLQKEEIKRIRRILKQIEENI